MLLSGIYLLGVIYGKLLDSISRVKYGNMLYTVYHSNTTYPPAFFHGQDKWESNFITGIEGIYSSPHLLGPYRLPTPR